MIKIAYRIVVKWLSGLSWSDFLQIVGMVSHADVSLSDNAGKEKREYVFGEITRYFSSKKNWGTFIINVLIELAYSWFRKQESK